MSKHAREGANVCESKIDVAPFACTRNCNVGREGGAGEACTEAEVVLICSERGDSAGGRGGGGDGQSCDGGGRRLGGACVGVKTYGEADGAKKGAGRRYISLRGCGWGGDRRMCGVCGVCGDCVGGGLRLCCMCRD